MLASPGRSPDRITPPLGPDEAHLWRIDLNQNADRLADFGASLSPDEQARASRYRFARDRNRFTACRGALRAILGRYLDRPAPAVAFAYGAHGKPALAASHASLLRFNVSHSGDTALIAATRNREVGVDIEQITDERDWEFVAPSVFSPREQAYMTRLTPGERTRAFFAFWTLKEAYLKATGAGLSGGGDPREVTVTLGEENRAALSTLDGLSITDWSLQLLDGDNGYVAALAVSGDSVSVRYVVFS